MIELRTNDRDWLASSPDDKIAVEPTEKGWRLFAPALTFINRAWDWTVDAYDPTNVKYLPIPERGGSGFGSMEIESAPDSFRNWFESSAGALEHHHGEDWFRSTGG